MSEDRLEFEPRLAKQETARRLHSAGLDPARTDFEREPRELLHFVRDARGDVVDHLSDAVGQHLAARTGAAHQKVDHLLAGNLRQGDRRPDASEWCRLAGGELRHQVASASREHERDPSQFVGEALHNRRECGVELVRGLELIDDEADGCRVLPCVAERAEHVSHGFAPTTGGWAKTDRNLGLGVAGGGAQPDRRAEGLDSASKRRRHTLRP